MKAYKIKNSFKHFIAYRWNFLYKAVNDFKTKWKFNLSFKMIKINNNICIDYFI